MVIWQGIALLFTSQPGASQLQALNNLQGPLLHLPHCASYWGAQTWSQPSRHSLASAEQVGIVTSPHPLAALILADSSQPISSRKGWMNTWALPVLVICTGLHGPCHHFCSCTSTYWYVLHWCQRHKNLFYFLRWAACCAFWIPATAIKHFSWFSFRLL